jgi:hypothetical protein
MCPFVASLIETVNIAVSVYRSPYACAKAMDHYEAASSPTLWGKTHHGQAASGVTVPS